MNRRDKNIYRFRKLKHGVPGISDYGALLLIWAHGDLSATPIGNAIDKNEPLPPLLAWAFDYCVRV